MRPIVRVALLSIALATIANAEVIFRDVKGINSGLEADVPGFSVVLLDEGDKWIRGTATIPNTPVDSMFGVAQQITLRVFDAAKNEICRAPLAARHSEEGAQLEFSLRRDLISNSFVSVCYSDRRGNAHFTAIRLGSVRVGSKTQ
jgi:hypothetical protein